MKPLIEFRPAKSQAVKKRSAYHVAWLKAHPNRTDDWFDAMMKHGFDVHHVDRNPENNSPSNLVMIEHADHINLHCLIRAAIAKSTPPKEAEPRVGKFDKTAYQREYMRRYRAKKAGK